MSLSLVSFHRFLIAAGIVFCAGFGLWQFIGSGEAAGSVPLGTVFLGLALRQMCRFGGTRHKRTNNRIFRRR